ncbi:MFS transporter [Paenibacillus sp. XY044]|uniref:MFS transporter n=1 Tax=Paenibacillus sp. XY044 TaxID=2026089 RepID=UPI000B98B567|nr:MFS transporter [Paenibacillus sp. XY044]OZB93687.1 hypothetical protein CJP46_22110 [Paenibacillus sp. XY044]
MNRGIYLLVLATFVTGTVELVVAGILDRIAQELHVSIGMTGLLVTVYSLVFALGTPIIGALTSRIERRKLLLAAMFVFIVGNVVSMVSPNFSILIVARAITAASCSVVVVNSLILAANITVPDKVGRAMGLVFTGISASLVLGVPIGTLIAGLTNWRMTFALIAVLGLIVFLGLWRYLPKVPPQPSASLSKQIAALRSSKIIFAQLMVALMLIGHFTMYTYLSPFLQSTMGLSSGTIGIVFLLLGMGGVVGGWIGGWMTDKLGGARSFLILLILFASVLLLLPYATTSLISLLPVVIVWGALAFAPAAPVQSYLIQSAPESSDIQIGLFTSFMHLGISIGSAVGGAIVNYHSVKANPWAAGLFGLLAFLSAAISVTRKQKGSRAGVHRIDNPVS